MKRWKKTGIVVFLVCIMTSVLTVDKILAAEDVTVESAEDEQEAQEILLEETDSEKAQDVEVEEAQLPKEAQTFASGNGTQKNPYQIVNAEQLLYFAQQVNLGKNADKHYQLTDNVYLKDVSWTPAGTVETPFSGVFDGGGYTISGLSLDSNCNYTGLFGLNMGTIENVTIEGSIKSSARSGNCNFFGSAAGFNAGTIRNIKSNVVIQADGVNFVGGIAGYNTSGKWLDTTAGGAVQKNIEGAVGNIIACANQGEVNGYKIVGGIVGENAGMIDRCCNTGSIINHLIGKGGGTGGIAGRNGNNDVPYENGSISNCYNGGYIDLNGGRWGGSLCGWANNYSAITNCYVYGNIETGYDDWAPLFPRSDGQETVANCYSLEGIPNRYPSMEKRTGTVVTKEEMKSYSFAEKLGSAFCMDLRGENQGYPVLKWQVSEAESPVTGILADASGAKTQYYVGDSLSMDGIYFYAVHADGTKELISPVYYRADRAVLVVEDDQSEITVSCHAFGYENSVPIKVTVRSRTLKTIVVTAAPVKFAYEQGEIFDSAGMKIKAVYEDGAAEAVSGGFAWSTNGRLSAENRTVTVSYTVNGVTKTDSFPVAVANTKQVPDKDSKGVYLLKTAKDLEWFSAAVSISGKSILKAKMVNNIDLSKSTVFEPIGKYGKETVKTANGGTLFYYWNNKFRGTFDGNKKTVAVALDGKDCVAFIGYADSAVIKNLTVKGKVSGTGSYVAGILARNDGKLTISGCTNQASVEVTQNKGITYVGGIIGRARNAAVTNCVNKGTIISSGSSVAGIAGMLTGSIKDCDNAGTIRGNASYAGGIVGFGTADLTVSRCSNTAAVTAGVNAGGMIGGGLTSSIKSCYNKGCIITLGSGASASAGGIIGRKGAKALQITDCYNTGKVMAANGGKALTGDLAGSADAGMASVRLTIQNSYYTGKRSVGSAKNALNDSGKKSAAQLSDMAKTLGSVYQNSCGGAVLTRQSAKAHTYGAWSPKDMKKKGKHTRTCKICRKVQTKLVK